MEKLNKLLSMCKCGVYLTINQHRDSYQSAKDRIKEMFETGQIDGDDISKDIIEKMVDTNNIVEIQFYPNTPIGSYYIYHYDLEMAINEALSCF